MTYKVIKVPLPKSETQFEDVIRECKPTGHELISIAVAGKELIMVFGKAI